MESILYRGVIKFRGTFVLGGFLSSGLWLHGFCAGDFCEELLTRYPEHVLCKFKVRDSRKLKQVFILFYSMIKQRSVDFVYQ